VARRGRANRRLAARRQRAAFDGTNHALVVEGIAGAALVDLQHVAGGVEVTSISAWITWRLKPWGST
jgi:hypothetical protein